MKALADSTVEIRAEISSADEAWLDQQIEDAMNRAEVQKLIKESTPRNTVATLALIVSALGLVATGIGTWVNWSNRSDSINEKEFEAKVAGIIRPIIKSEFDAFKTGELKRLEDQVSDHQKKLEELGKYPVKGDTSFDALKDDIADIRANMRSMDQQIKDAIKRSATLPSGQLQQQLPNVQVALELARIRGIEAKDPDIAKLRNSLGRLNADSPQYWSVVSMATSAPESAAVNPRRQPIDRLMEGNNITGGTYVLDGARWLNNTFRDAVIIYEGGNVILGPNRFENCRFILRVKSTPPAAGQRFVKTLLGSSDLATVSLG